MVKFKKDLKKSSKIWLDRQHKDVFVKKAKQEGYRSRAAYKLLEIQKKHSLLKPGMLVIDLGAAPGSWSQVAIKYIASYGHKLKAKLLAVDILPIEPIENVDIINGDFTNELIFQQICAKLIGKADIILSDVAPNLTGMWAVDIPKAIYLSELALDLVKKLLKKDGDFLIKLFNGEGLSEYLVTLRQNFTKVIICKPKCSRKESREVYALAKGYKGL